jgi:hypothetical protein
VGDNSGGRRVRAFASLAGNGALLRVLAAYVMFILTEYAVWIAMLAFAFGAGAVLAASGSAVLVGRADRVAALAAVVRRTACTRDRGPGIGPYAGAAARRRRLDPAG